MSGLKDQIYLIAEDELADMAEDRAIQQAAQQRQKRKVQALIASGMLLTSLLGAAGGMTYGEARHRTLSEVEADAISNLMDYVAYKMHATRDWVEDVLLAQFNVRSLADLRARHYDDVIEYLLHLVH